MNWRSNLVALLLVSGLASYWYFYEHKGQPLRDKAKADAELVFPGFEPAEAVEMTLAVQGKAAIVLRKQGTTWRLAAPIEAQADQAQVTQVLDQFKSLKNEGTVAEKDARLSDFGLESPSASATLLRVSKTALTIAFGNANPGNQYVYAQVSGSAAVLMVQDYSKAHILKELKMLRDKTVWNFQPENLVGVHSSILLGFKLEKNAEGAWKMAWPGKQNLKSAAMKDWIAQLGQLQVAEFVDETGKDAARYGLGKKARKLELVFKGSPSLTLVQGLPVPKGKGQGNYYQVEGRPLIFTMPEYMGANIAKKAEDLVEKEDAKEKKNETPAK